MSFKQGTTFNWYLFNLTRIRSYLSLQKALNQWFKSFCECSLLFGSKIKPFQKGTYTCKKKFQLRWIPFTEETYVLLSVAFTAIGFHLSRLEDKAYQEWLAKNALRHRSRRFGRCAISSIFTRNSVKRYCSSRLLCWGRGNVEGNKSFHR